MLRMTRKLTLAAIGSVLASLVSPASAALPTGAKAPDFSTQGALAGKPFAFHLAEALKHGPVVLYFYPKAFTSGCTMEAHAFAAAMDDFHKAGATVLGLSADNMQALESFSTKECSNKFPVGIASPAIISAYDAPLKMALVNTGLASRTTYVIAPDGHIALAYTAMDWKEHVPKALAAVRALKH